MRRLLALFALAACGGAAVSPVGPRLAATATPAPKEAARSEHPLTPASLALMTDFALAPRMGQPYRERKVYPLAGGGVGFLDSQGERAIATLSEVRVIDTPHTLTDLCVAHDGKATIALTQDSGGPARVWRADSFDGPMTVVGLYRTQILREPDRRPIWVVSDEKAGTSILDCESGAMEKIAPPSSSAAWSRWDDALRIVRLEDATKASWYCLVRTPADKAWNKMADCDARERGDGSVTVALLPDARAHTPWKCVFVVDARGKKLGCDAPVGKEIEPARPSIAFEPTLAEARFFASGRLVVPAAGGALQALDPSGHLDPASHMGAGLQSCSAVSPTLPLYACQEGAFDDVVSVGADGSVRTEQKRRRPPPTDDGRPSDPSTMVHVTFDGGAALGGACDGTLGNVACVRTDKGEWHDVAFSPELVTALNRTAPATRLVPTPDGQLYVGTATMDGLLSGSVHVLLFRADRGPGTAVEKIPAWILSSLGGVGGVASLVTSRQGAGPSLGWTTSRRVRVWPLEREHPAFHTKESCRVDIDLDGSFDTECVQGRLFAVGRMGLWEKRPGELYETLDAAETWTPVHLPKGVETDDVVCFAAGCRIGPYWRMGWGG